VAKLLFTGNRGFFGTRFEAIFGDRHTILGIDKDDVDIVNADAVNTVFEQFRPELVIHAAAITSTDFSNAQPELTRRINVDGAVNVARACRAVGARLIFFSTEQVFNGNQESGPYAETDTAVPNTAYGETKLEAESLLREITEELWILRFTWLFGLPERNMPVNPNILWNAFQIAVSGKKTAVATNEFRGHTYGYDMITQVMNVPDIPYGTYHIGSSNELGRYELTRHILAEMGLEDRLDDLLLPDEKKYSKPRDIRLSTDKLAAAGITFPESSEALSRCLSEFGLRGAFSG